MPITSTAIGTDLPPHVVEVSVRRLLAYAAAVGELGPHTFDDAGGHTLVAVPAFCAALEWPVLSSPARVAALGLRPDEVRGAVLAGQDSTFHRTIGPGDRLRTSGCIAGLRQTRAGVLVTTRLDTLDDDDLAPVTTTWHHAMYRGVRLAGTELDQADSSPPPTPLAEPLREVRVGIPPEAAHVYTECTDIWNPIHTERRAALAAGLGGIILHGTATWAIAGREIVRACAGGDPSRLRRLRARFAAPVVPGTTIRIVFGDPGPDGEVSFEVRIPNGDVAISHGLAEIGPSGVGRTSSSGHPAP
jgi:acyl dehydratase